ncbi:MAG: tetratricopeptide repeat protein [Akkermansiaceae bacterium]
MRIPTALLQLQLVLLCFVSPIQAQTGGFDGNLYTKAEQYFKYGTEVVDSYEKARYMDYSIGLFKEYLDKYPNGANAAGAYYHIGFAEQSLGRIDDAERLYKVVIQRYRKGNSVGLAANKLAWLAFSKEDWANSAKFFATSAANVTNQEVRFSALTKRVECLTKLGRDTDVIDALANITTARGHPHMAWAQFMLGYQYYQMEAFEKTIEILKPLTSASTAGTYRAQAMFYAGLASVELGRDDDAQDYLRQVLAVSITNPSLTSEQRKQIAHNKAMAQTGLMSFYFKKEDYSEVAKLFTLGDFGATGRTEARRSMTAGKSLYRLKRFHDARSAFRRVDRSVPNTPEAFDAAYRCLLCDYQMKNSDLPDRVNVFLGLYGDRFSVSPNLHMAAFLKAETLYHVGDYEAAANSFSEVDVELLPRNRRAELLFKRGWCQAEIGDNNGATRNLSEFIKDFPDDPRYHESLAVRADAFSTLGDRMPALRDYETLLKAEPQPELRSVALQGSARVLRDEKKYAVMVERYRLLLTEFSDLPTNTMGNANYWIGWGYYKLEKYDDARPYLEKAQEMIPEFYNEPAGNILVLLNFKQGKADEMNKVLNRLLSDFPGKTIPNHMLTWLGLQLFHVGNFADSVRFLDRATDPEKPKGSEVNVWRSLAKGQNELKQSSKALRSAKIVLSLEKEPRWKADSQLDIAEAYLGLGMPVEATKSAQAGLDIGIPGAHTAGLHLVLGQVVFQNEKYQEALNHFETTLSIAVDDPAVTPEALYWAAQSAEKLSDVERASIFRSRLVNSFPSWQVPAQTVPERE